MFCSVSYPSNAQNLQIVLAKYHNFKLTSETKDQLGMYHCLLSRRTKTRFFRIRRNRIGIYFTLIKISTVASSGGSPEMSREEEDGNCSRKSYPPRCPQQSALPLSPSGSRECHILSRVKESDAICPATIDTYWKGSSSTGVPHVSSTQIIVVPAQALTSCAFPSSQEMVIGNSLTLKGEKRTYI